MNNVIKLTKCYIETMMTIKKQVLLVVFASLILAVSSEAGILYGSILAVAILINQSLSYEDISGVDFLVATLPVRKSEYVLSRYMGALIVLILSIIVLTTSYLVSILANSHMPIIGYGYFFIILITVSTIMISVLIPINLKWGSQKGRILSTLMIIVPCISALSIIRNISSNNRFDIFISNPIILILGLILVNMIILGLSYFITVKLYENKEVKK